MLLANESGNKNVSIAVESYGFVIKLQWNLKFAPSIICWEIIQYSRYTPIPLEQVREKNEFMK